MNDKWIAGNSIGQRSLLEEFLFLDKANKDIGDVYFFNLTRLKALSDPMNSKISLYSVISTMLQDTGFDMRALPAYINFYGTNYSNKPKIAPSKNIAKNIENELDTTFCCLVPKLSKPIELQGDHEGDGGCLLLYSLYAGLSLAEAAGHRCLRHLHCGWDSICS